MYDIADFEKGRKMVWNFAKTATLNEYDADDITQEVLAEAVKNADLFETCESPAGLLYMIAKHKVSEFFRKKKHYLVFEPYKYEQASESLIDEIIQHENSREMHDALSALPDKYARLIILQYYYDLSLKQIAKMTNENYNTVVWRHNQALKLLREQLGDTGGQDRTGRKQKQTIRTFILLYGVELWASAQMMLKNGYRSLYGQQ